ncbi:hypothetical protein Tco_1241985, partial [Tanacetum coccineum]
VLEIENGICLNQIKYCLELLAEFGMLACKPTYIPVSDKVTAKSAKNVEVDEPLVGVNNYQKLVGKLIYLTLTRPDISHSVHCLSQVMHAPTKKSLKSAFKVLRYLKRSPDLGLTFRHEESLDLNVFVDSDWDKCKKSKMQYVLARSLAEAEFRAMCSVTCECSMKRTKHFELDLYFLTEKIQDGIVKTAKVKSVDNIVDVFTKGAFVAALMCEHPPPRRALDCDFWAVLVTVLKVFKMMEEWEMGDILLGHHFAT